MHLGSLESTQESAQEARVALGYRQEQLSYASLVLSKLPACIYNSYTHAKPEPILKDT